MEHRKNVVTSPSISYKAYVRIGDFLFNVTYVHTVTKSDSMWEFKDYRDYIVIEIPTSVDKNQDKDALTLFMEHNEAFRKYKDELENEGVEETSNNVHTNTFLGERDDHKTE